MSHTILSYIYSLLESSGVTESTRLLTTIIAATLFIIVAAMLYWVLAYPVSKIINRRILNSNTLLDDYLFSPRNLHAICIAAVTILSSVLFPALFEYYPGAKALTDKICSVLNICALANAVILLARGGCDFLNSGENTRSGSLVIRNLITTIVASIAALLIISIILNRDVAYVISGLGAMAAVLMLVFKDSLLGMTAGVRLTVNKMLKVNDWVSVPKYNAEGRVEDLTLTSIKIRNWDQSISSVPPHALISDGFTNHEAMLDRGLRQIKRTFNVDVNSIRLLTTDEMKQFRGAEWSFGIDTEQPAVNLTLFRRWLRNEIASHPRFSEHPRYFVKEHPHTATGVPIEIHFFVRCTDWAEFEELQADFLDNIIASFCRFRLRLFQSPSGLDFSATHTSSESAQTPQHKSTILQNA